jgi:group I intron endonuclease
MLNFDCGIYTITSPSGKQYVGSAVSFRYRWWLHLRDLRKGAHHCVALQRAFKKYGEDALVFAKVAFVPKDDLIRREQEQIDARPRRSLYNTALVAGSCLGVKRSAEVREQNRQRKLGSVHSAETKAKMSATRKGRKRSEATIAKTARSNTGRKRSDASLARMAASRIGRTLSEEHKKKIGESGKGRKHTPETKAKISETKLRNKLEKATQKLNPQESK